MMHHLHYLTAGESHGRGLVGILEGLPADIPITEEYINAQLARRQLGFGRSRRMKIEQDRVQIWAGVRHGRTIGSPVAFIIENREWAKWSRIMSPLPMEGKVSKITHPRPGHADLAGIQKFGFQDIRNVLERSSARETAMRVALGSVCRKMLKHLGIEVGSRVTQIHTVKDLTILTGDQSPRMISKRADASPVRCLDPECEKRMLSQIRQAQKEGDSVGGIFELVATGLPYGLGSYTQWYRKLNTRLAAALMSVNAFKGYEIGLGFASSEHLGSEVHDPIEWDQKHYVRPSNNAGGIEGGMSNAQPLLMRLAMKPIPTLIKPLPSVDVETKQPVDAHKERTDTCAVPAASIVAESMVCLVLADAVLEKFGGDSLPQLLAHMDQTAVY